MQNVGIRFSNNIHILLFITLVCALVTSCNQRYSFRKKIKVKSEVSNKEQPDAKQMMQRDKKPELISEFQNGKEGKQHLDYNNIEKKNYTSKEINSNNLIDSPIGPKPKRVYNFDDLPGATKATQPDSIRHSKTNKVIKYKQSQTSYSALIGLLFTFLTFLFVLILIASAMPSFFIRMDDYLMVLLITYFIFPLTIALAFYFSIKAITQKEKLRGLAYFVIFINSVIGFIYLIFALLLLLYPPYYG
ncbi:MAG: hypothetical protein MUC81_00415 [Bacteroidia bacterium]|nr:hypothetical protein [Bacteroidia bacterium]